MIMNDELADLIPKIMKSMIIRIQYGYEIRKFPVINEKKINHAFYLANPIQSPPTSNYLFLQLI